jgi:putative tricarboxylic transport membrane protein
MQKPIHKAPAKQRGIFAVWAAEVLVAGILLLLGAITMFDSARIGAGWDHGPEAGYFPFYIGLIIAVSSIVIIISSIRKRADMAEAFVEHDQLKRVLMVFLPTVVYTVAIYFIGIYVSSAILITAFMRWQGKYSWLRSLLVGLGFVAFMFPVFEIWFQVELPKGPLEALFGY